eukprot:TRINITY_DN7917_c0_g2_i3.p1 TRINITY_DN7917_c0_g2~~TRINITY_DN7917_c0_g2_i3.p1  ORF type:complete len:153 (-),score=18.99 TRINITY_DN7917_c0_g2_i3:32-490(-)
MYESSAIAKSKTSSVRKELLLATAAPPFASKHKYGVAFVLRQRKQSNAVCMVRKGVDRLLCFPKTNAGNCGDNGVDGREHSNSASIAKMVISGKKLEKSQRITTEIRARSFLRSNFTGHFQSNAKNALTKIQSLGLLTVSYTHLTLPTNREV